MLKTKSILIFSLIFIIFSCLLFFVSVNKEKNPHQSKTIEIIESEEGFSPEEIAIKIGDKIRFSTMANEPFWPASDLHPTHGILPEFDPQQPIKSEDSWTFQFLKTGSWKYHDHLNPGRRGIIHVTP